MSQVSDVSIANQGFSAFRTELNNILGALNSMHSGTSRPASATTGTIWLDTTNSGSNSLEIKFFDGSDDIQFAIIDTSANTVNFIDSVTGTTINNNADNRVITGSGSANTLEGESGLTYDGSTLDVTGTVKSDLSVIDSTGGATPTYSHTNNSEGITLRYNDDSGARNADFVATGNTPAGATMAMRFFVNPNSTDAASEVMRIQNGNVGIGTSSPSFPLHVSGKIYGSGVVASAGNSFELSDNNVTVKRATDDMTLSTGGTERMRITSSGEVLIGGTNSDYVDAGGIQTNGSGTQRTYGLYHNGTTSGIDLVNWNSGLGSGGLGSGGNFLQLTDGGNTRFKFKGDGNATCDGSFSGGGADYAEYFEWADGNSNNEDRIGLSVILDNGKIREATASDTNIIGVVSSNPTVVGDEQPHHWKDKFVTDDFGRVQYETLTSWKWEIYDENEKTTDGYIEGRTDKEIPENATNVESFEHSYEMINPNYDENLEYTPRSQRQEWSCVGLMGKLKIKKGQQTNTNWIKIRDVSDTVDEWLIK